MLSSEVKEQLVKISGLVEPAIKKLLSDGVDPKNQELAFYQCASGGKRIRPTLLITSGQVFGADINDLIYPAAAVEIMHNSTLIADDIIDHSEFRRDKPTCWKNYGRSAAECMILEYMAAVYEGLMDSKNCSVLTNLFSKTLKKVIDGELNDILFERSGRNDEDYVVKNRYKTITTDDYFDMIGKKTAVLLKCCCMAGAIVADASYAMTEIIGDFGFNLGLAFQIRDDSLDIYGDEKEFGKKIGKDIIEKKMGNFVILTAMDQLNAVDKKLINKLLTSTANISAKEIKTVTDLLDKTDAKEIADSTANYYIGRAYHSLDKLPQNEYTENLRQIARFIVDREA